MKKTLAALLALLSICSSLAVPVSAEVAPPAKKNAKKKVEKPVEPPLDPSLPNVLILGDSISIGYTKQVREALSGKANVVRPNANCGSTVVGLAGIDKWLGDQRWQVIHFNWGLHDLCYRNPEAKAQGNRDKVNGKQSVSPADYEKNLETLVARLQKTGATLIWASTTVVPDGEAGRIVGDDLKYNAVAERVMKKHGVTINDLHAVSKSFAPDLFVGPGDVHFTPAGSARLAQQVANQVTEALNGRSKK